jgi:F-type H+-transporting ATPase subunit delta
MPSAISTRYAKALADAVLAPASHTEPAQALTELRAFEQMVDSSPELRNVLLSPAVPTVRKRAVIARLAPAVPLSPLVRNFLFVVIDRRRGGLLGEMAAAFESALDERTGIVRVEVRSAVPLDASQQAALGQELSKIANKQVRCEFFVDPTLIGGVVARMGSTLYDGSVRTQLDTLRERLTAR